MKFIFVNTRENLAKGLKIRARWEASPCLLGNQVVHQHRGHWFVWCTEKWHTNNIQGWPKVVDPRLPKGCIFKGFIIFSFAVISTASKITAWPSNGAQDSTLQGNLSWKTSFLDKRRKRNVRKNVSYIKEFLKSQQLLALRSSLEEWNCSVHYFILCFFWRWLYRLTRTIM